MSRFRDALSWVGTYDGRLDGRRALLDIHHSQPDTPEVLLIAIKDLDREVASFDGVPISKFTSHDARDIILLGGVRRNIKQLLMHTWNSDFISGTSNWEGREFGMFFVRSSKR